MPTQPSIIGLILKSIKSIINLQPAHMQEASWALSFLAHFLSFLGEDGFLLKILATILAFPG